jgi:hypothetical protein
VDLIRAITNTPPGNQPDNPHFEASGPYASFPASVVGGDGIASSFSYRETQLGDTHSDRVMRPPIARRNPTEKATC